MSLFQKPGLREAARGRSLGSDAENSIAPPQHMDNFMLQQAPVKEFAEVARVSLNIEGYQSILRDIINMDPGEEWESGVIQQLLRRLYRCESGHIGTGY